MQYDPANHVPTLRTIAAAWLVCVGIALCALVLPSTWHWGTTLVAAARASSPAQPHSPLSRREPSCSVQCLDEQHHSFVSWIPMRAYDYQTLVSRDGLVRYGASALTT